MVARMGLAGHLLRSRSSTMARHRLRRDASYLAGTGRRQVGRSQRDRADFHHGLLGPLVIRRRPRIFPR